MSYQIVIIIIIVTAVVSYLIGLFDAKTTNKWFGTENKKKNEPTKAEPEIKLNIRRLADIQINDQHELLVSYEQELEASKYSISALNKSKLTELITVLETLSTNVTNKPVVISQQETSEKVKLAIEQPLFRPALKKQASKKPAALGLVGLLNEQLDLMKDQNPFLLEIKENPDHSLLFLVNERAFSALDDIEPAEARSQFRRAIEAVSGDS